MRFHMSGGRLASSSLHTGLHNNVVAKVTSFVLVFLFIVTPFAPLVHAQEPLSTDTAETTITDSTETTQISPKDTTSSQPELDTTSNVDVVPLEHGNVEALAGTDEADTTSILDRQALNFSGHTRVDETGGSFEYALPITVPPGRSGMEPSLSLTYNSARVRNDSAFGYGWELSIPYIERINRRGTNRLYSDPYYYSTLDGELVQVSATMFKPRQENGNFHTYTLSSNTWTVTEKDGVAHLFGNASTSRMDDTNNSNNIFRWMLAETRDTNNNSVRYVYYKDAGQIYPDTIYYTGQGSTDGPFTVTFSREARPDHVVTYAPAFKLTTNYRINEIATKIDGSWVTKYTLDYTVGDNGSSTLLASVTESGRDDAQNVVALPPTNFSYQTATASWENSTTWELPHEFFDKVKCGDQGMRVVDINGDYLPDLLWAYSCPEESAQLIFMNTGSGWSTTSATHVMPGSFVGGGHDYGVRLADVNGDGLVDWVQGYRGTNHVYLNTGTTWQLSGWSTPYSFVEVVGGDHYDTGQRLADVNGDGLVDVIISFQEETWSTPQKKVYINSGVGWTLDTSWDIPLLFRMPGWTSNNVHIADINSDGLTDLIHGQDIYINTGTGWEEDTLWELPYGIQGWEHFADVNGDGRTDLLRAVCTGTYDTYINTGVGWSLVSDWDMPEPLSYQYYSFGTVLSDVNGDGVLDELFGVDAFAMGLYDACRADIIDDPISVNLGQHKQVDILTGVETPQGGEIEVDYKLSADYTNGSNELLNPKLPLGVLTVSKVSEKTREVVSDSEYTYGGGYYYTGQVHDRRFAGFATTTRTDGLGNVTKSYYHQGNGSQTTLGEYQDHITKIGKPYRTEVYDASNHLYETTVNRWDSYAINATSSFVKLATTTTLTYDGDGDHRDTASEYIYDNTYGNLMQKTEYGEVTASTDGTYTDTGTDKRTTTLTYVASTTPYIVGLPKQETLKNNIDTTVSDTKYYYDTLPHGSVNKGNITKTEQWVSGSTWIDTEKSYNAYGLVTQEKDPRDKATNYTFDTFNMYPATTTNPLGHITYREYDYSSGKMTKEKNPNGLWKEITYDGLDRPTEEKQPDITNPTTLVTKTAYEYTDTKAETKVKRVEYLDSTHTTDSYRYFDGLGRLIQTRTRAEDANTFSVTDRIYNERGELKRESAPYLSLGTASTTATTTSALFTTYTYDTLGRPETVTNAVGTTTYMYDQWETVTTDPMGIAKDHHTDAYSNLSKVEEHNGTTTYTTLYEYSPLGSLTKVTDALSNVRNFTYDGLSRRASAEDLHAPGDTTFGTWVFTYDSAGNLASQVDPKSQTVNYTYDDINRPLTEDYTGQSGTEVQHIYDSCTRGVGRVCTSVNSGATTTYAYTHLGLPGTTTRTISGTLYTLKQVYDRQGNQTLVTYPDNSEVRYTYNAQNLPETVEQKEGGGSWNVVVSDMDYGPHGLLLYQKNGNNTETWKTYDANELYRLRTIVTTATENDDFSRFGDEFEATGFEILSTQGTREAPLETIEMPETVVSEVVIEEESDSAPEESTDTTNASYNTRDVLPQEDAVEVLHNAETDVFATTTENSTTTEPLYFDLEETISSPMIYPSNTAAVSTVPVEEAKDVIGIPAPQKKLNTSHYVKNVHDATVWRKYYKERLVGVQATMGETSRAYAQALFAHDEYERQLLDAGYIQTPEGVIDGTGLDWVRGVVQKGVEEILSFILPKQVYAYLFNAENFESCTSLPCSFSGNLAWGSVTPSLDTTGKVYGTKSLKETVNGQGGGALEYANINENEMYARFSVYVPSDMTWGQSGFVTIFQAEDSNNNVVFWLSVENWGTARLTVSGDTLPWTNTGIDLVKGAVNDIEVRFKKGTTDGDIDIWHNSTTEGTPTFNGNGTLNTGTDNVDDVLIGVTYAPEALSTLYFDEVTIDSAFIGNPTTPTMPFTPLLQHLTYTYDALGNITQIIDASRTKTAATTSYQYDDLSRLTSASTTQASTTPYLHTYTYNPLGNITAKSDIGTYTYGDDTGTTVHTVYDDTLASSWDNWSWGGTYNVGATTPVYAGTNSIQATYTSQYGGLQLRNGSLATSGYSTLSFAVYIESGTNLAIIVKAYNKDTNTQLGQTALSSYLPGGTYTQGTWHTVSIPLSVLGIDNFTGNGAIVFQSDGQPTAVLYYDQIMLVGTAGGESPYANPHAVTSVHGHTYTYDHNGNLTSDGTRTNTWDYRNRLIASGGTATTSYLYDEKNQRTAKTTPLSTTHYPFPLYEAQGATTTKHIYVGDTIVATIRSDTPTATYYNHQDHLGSTNVVSTSEGYLNQELAYYPFGSMRVDELYGTLNQKNRYTGHEYDDDTEMYYMRSRYQVPDTGRFVSQDPAFLDIGDPSFKQKYNRPVELFLANPQQLNSYSYVNNNPLNLTDPDGRCPICVALAAPYISGALTALTAVTSSAFLSSMVADDISTATNPGASPSDRGLAGIGIVPLGMITKEAKMGVDIVQKVKAIEKVVDATKTATKPHGNSFLHPGPAYGYYLRDRAAGEVVKIGETLYPKTRYSISTLNRLGVSLEPRTGAMTKSEVRTWEKQEIQQFEKKTGSKPKLNKVNH